MTKCYILGAGASYGYNEHLRKQECPPLTNEFFTKGYSTGIFNEEQYPSLSSSLNEYLKESNNNINSVDVEKFLAWLHEKFTQSTNLTFSDARSSRDFDRDYQKALGEAFLFIWDLLRYFTAEYNPEFDAYRRLALHFFDEKYNVITLNYDCIFETAVQSIGCTFHYFPAITHPRSIGIAKLHGSVNWINPCTRDWGGAIAFGGLQSEKAIETVASVIYSNKMWTSNIPVDLPIPHLRYLRIPDLIRSGTDWDEPAIIPPLEDYKDYDKTPRYDHVWKYANAMLQNATKLVLIGCSIRDSDKKFIELLSTSIGKKQIPITVVDPNSNIIINQLNKYLQSPIFELIKRSFTEYARTLRIASIILIIYTTAIFKLFYSYQSVFFFWLQ